VQFRFARRCRHGRARRFFRVPGFRRQPRAGRDPAAVRIDRHRQTGEIAARANCRDRSRPARQDRLHTHQRDRQARLRRGGELRGERSGYAATSPKKTGKKLKQNQAAVGAYMGYIAAYESTVLDAVKGRVPTATVRQSFRTVYGGVAMTLPANKIGDLLSVQGVVAVQEDSLEQPLTDVTPTFLGADQVWPSLGGSTKAGEGVIVGVLDTGIWPEHPSLVDHRLAPPHVWPVP